nr:PREDICTED: uncharacterized protein LOC109032174 isoform X2 [Bemisia tabaci]
MMMEEMEEEGPNRCTTIVYYAWKLFTCLFVHVMLITMVVGYCVLGAYTFERLEKQHEKDVKKNISYMRNNVTEDLWMFSNNELVFAQENWTAGVKKRLKLFENDLVMAMRKNGWDGSEDESALQWNFFGALFYSIIVITTIGYGHIAPKTPYGKITTIFYAIVGIPLMLVCLSNIGDIMAQSFRFLYWRVFCYACTRHPKRPAYGRRPRSLRGTVRSHGRSGRSRTASFRRSGRTSHRSADSALGMSESFTRSSYSDTECRYYDEAEREAAMLGPGGRPFRPSQQSRHSDLAAHPSTHRNHLRGDQFQNLDVEALDLDDLPPTTPPILYNKYALDREDSRRARPPQNMRHFRNQKRSPRDADFRSSLPPSQRQHLSVEPVPLQRMSPRARGYRDAEHHHGGHHGHHHHSNPSPRIMSPLGFAVNRQSFPRRDYDYYSDMELDEYYSDDYSQANHIKPVPIWLCVFLVVSYIIGGAFLFSGWEGWGYPDSAYFCFITLTTIGFGDFVPAQNKKDAEFSIACCSLYLLFGIALLAMSFNLVQEEVISNVKAVARHLGIIKDDDGDDDDD